MIKTLFHRFRPAVVGTSVAALLTACSGQPADAPTPAEPEASSVSSEPARSAPNGDAMSEDAMKPEDSAMEEADRQKYANGTYTADGMYTSPAGEESVTVSLTLEDNIITDVNVEGHATVPKSQDMQSKFSEGIGAMVVGKSIDEVDVDVVNGSSLTGIGFTEALAKIKAEAAL